jgi:hypothetical protein
MLIKIVVLIMMFFFSRIVFSKSIDIQTNEKRSMGTFQVGVADPKIIDKEGQSKNEVFYDLSLTGRYAFSDNIGFKAGIGKWLGGQELVANYSGNLAYHLDAGFIFAVSGSLIDSTKIETNLISEKKEFADKYKVITKLQKKTSKNNFNGFRVSIHGSEYSFSMLDKPIYGVGGSVFYEQRMCSNYLQYGIKGDVINKEFIHVSLIQAFVGIGF